MRRRHWFILLALLGIVPFWVFVTTASYMSRLPHPGDQLVKGRIINMEVQQINYTGSRYVGPRVSYSTYLTIKIVNTNTVVKTVVHEDWTNRTPEIVTFYFSGNPNQMVFLQEDTLPLREMMSAWQLAGIELIVVIVIFVLVYVISTVVDERAIATRNNQPAAYTRYDDYDEFIHDDEFAAQTRQEEFEAFLKKINRS